MKQMWLSAFLVLFTTGCVTRVPFTHRMRSDYNLGEAELRHLQYFVSNPITLQREMASAESMVTRGHYICVQEGRRVEEVRLRRGTPGVAVRTGVDTLEVSFESGNSLTFRSAPLADLSRIGYYELVAEEWRDGRGRIHYEGRTFWTLPGSEDAYLLVGLRELRRARTRSRTMPGLRQP